ncbi:MAG: heme-binding protein [Bacteroidales bacterium]|nr:heme-binding protein [Bacteroidales bacterium]
MNKFLKISVLIIIAFALFWAISLFISKEISATSSIVVKSSSQVVFEKVNNVENWKNWNVWHKADTTMQITYGSVKIGERATYSWQSENKNAGSGTVVINKSTLLKEIEAEILINNANPFFVKYEFSETDSGIVIKASIKQNLKSNPILKFLKSGLQKTLTKGLDMGLQSLKQLCEGENSKQGEIKMLDEQLYIYENKTVLKTDLYKELSKSFLDLYTYVELSNGEIAGNPFCVYTQIDFKSVTIEAALPIKNSIPEDSDYKIKKRKKGKYAIYNFSGTELELENKYQEFLQWLTASKITINELAIEEYINTPKTVSDTSIWKIKIHYFIE